MNFCAFYTTILARRSTARNGTTQNDTFGYNARSELTSATLGSDNYAYAFDNIGNRNSATETGTWQITYNGANRPVRFRNEESDTTIDCGYDSQGRRYFKKVTVSGTVTLHHRYIYRGYFQIAAVDMTRSGQPDLWLTTWDPSQATATRPLAIQKDGTWFTYGYDLTKNICEVFGPAGYIRTAYSYAPFGAVTASDNSVVQPFQWSSEHYDSELDLVYYNYRHYSPSLGRFLSRDPIEEQGGLNLYAFVGNNAIECFDDRGLLSINFILAIYSASPRVLLRDFDFSLDVPASLDDILEECKKECVDKLKKELKARLKTVRKIASLALKKANSINRAAIAYGVLTSNRNFTAQITGEMSMKNTCLGIDISVMEIYETNNKKGKIAGVVGGLAYQLPEEAVPMSKDIERGIRKVASNVFKKFSNRLP